MFWQDAQSIVSVNDWEVSVVSRADLKPGDTVAVQTCRKTQQTRMTPVESNVIDENEATEALAAARLSPSSFSQGSETDAPCQRSSRKQKATSTEPEFKQKGGTKKPRNKGVLNGWCCWYCSSISVMLLPRLYRKLSWVHGAEIGSSIAWHLVTKCTHTIAVATFLQFLWWVKE